LKEKYLRRLSPKQIAIQLGSLAAGNKDRACAEYYYLNLRSRSEMRGWNAWRAQPRMEASGAGHADCLETHRAFAELRLKTTDFPDGKYCHPY